jgi:hypothetical protein
MSDDFARGRPGSSVMSDLRCSLCHTGFDATADSRRCDECGAVAHADCWAENGGCGTYGCSHAPKPVQQSTATPVTYWGQEKKACPACGREIRAAALRCRFCDARFETAAPMTRAQFADRAGHRTATRALGDRAVWYFVGGVLPCAAPLTLVAGGLHLRAHRREMAALPPLRRLMIHLGLGLSGLWVLVSLVAVLVF